MAHIVEVRGKEELLVKWFEMDTKSPGKGTVKYNLTNNEDVIPTESVMYWNFSFNRGEKNLILSRTDYVMIRNLYDEHDDCYK